MEAQTLNMENHSQDLNQIVHQLLVTMDSKLEEMKAQIQGLPTPASESSSSPRHVTTETYQAPTDLLCSMRMDVLRFDGSDPEGWVFRVEEFFNFLSTPEEMRLKIVSFHMEGPAAAWYQWMKNNQLLKSWKEFLVSLKLRFGSSDYEDYEGRLSKLTQKTTVAEFQTEFEGLMNKVTGISETLLISFFVAGLKPEIGREMLMNRPTSLMETFRVARAHEARFEDARVSMHYGPKGVFNPSPNQACNLRNPQINPPARNPMTHPVSMTHPNITCPNPRPPSPSSTFSCDEGEEGDDSSNKNDKSKEIKKWPMFADLGGLRGVIDELIKEVIVPFHHPQLARHLQVKPITGILLHGPPGCGKTTLAEAIANETGVPFHKISAAELVSGCTGASERKIQELFSKANRTAPSIVFIDEIDAVASKREKLRGKGPRIVTQLITSMDESRKLVKPVDKNGGSGSSNCRPGYVLVIGATNRPDVIDRALRRPGRFDREILLGVPDESARIQILSKLTCNCKVEGALDLAKIGSSTPGFVGADLRALCDKAGNLAMNRIMDQRKVELSKEQKDSVCSEDYWRPPVPDEEMESLSITMADFEEAVQLVQPSSKREGFSEIPNVKWDDVGGLHLLRKEFERHIIRRIKSPEIYEDLGLDLPTGFLLYGPPGCGKTLIAKAVANEAGANFIHIKGPEILDKYVGETERAVRTIFSRARTCAPCIIFFDEVDALTRKNNRNHGSGLVVQQLVAQLLIELDGGVQRKNVYVIGATNRPEVMNTAVLRPGRFGKLVYVPLPSRDERGMILKALARNKPIDANVDLMALGKDSACDNFSGADLSALMYEAAMESLDDRLVSPPPWTIKDVHFKRALEKISPSVSDEQIEYYKLLSKTLRAA